MRLRLFHGFVLTGRLQKATYLPDSASSRELHLAQNEIVNARVGVEYDTRDYPLNPRSGIFYNSNYTFGLKHNLGPSYLFTQDSLARNENLHSIFLHFEFYYPLWSNQVFAFSLSGKQVKGNQLQLTDYFWFGGSRSLRGYRENQFRGSSVAWTNLEYRFIMARKARIFLFNDWGFYSALEQGSVKQEILPGYGLGLRFETPLGIMGVDFGLGKGDSFREAKIHFGLVNRF
jgi:outer membrane protein insertion porin family